jgi:hypothetical protein
MVLANNAKSHANTLRVRRALDTQSGIKRKYWFSNVGRISVITILLAARIIAVAKFGFTSGLRL